MKIMLDEGAYKPNRAHSTDAGLDIRSPKSCTIPPMGSVVVHTGVHVQLPRHCAGILLSKSGLNVKHGITSEGLIDEGYTGEIIVKLYNNSHDYYKVNEGDKISQLVVVPVFYEDVELVKEFEVTERGSNGFGSSGK